MGAGTTPCYSIDMVMESAGGRREGAGLGLPRQVHCIYNIISTIYTSYNTQVFIRLHRYADIDTPWDPAIYWFPCAVGVFITPGCPDGGPVGACGWRVIGRTPVERAVLKGGTDGRVPHARRAAPLRTAAEGHFVPEGREIPLFPVRRCGGLSREEDGQPYNSRAPILGYHCRGCFRGCRLLCRIAKRGACTTTTYRELGSRDICHRTKGGGITSSHAACHPTLTATVNARITPAGCRIAPADVGR